MRPGTRLKGNLLLESLSRECGLERWLETVRFPRGHEIACPGETLKHFYFPTSGVLSTLVDLREGTTTETLTIGNEGMVGLPIWLGVPSSLEWVLQHTAGELIRIPARIFCERLVGHRRAERLLKHFTAYTLRSGVQSVVCHTHHTVQQRASRWLLTMADRANGLKLKLTQSLLARVLGVRRQSVSEVARKLQKAGIIAYRHGELRIDDRDALEDRACECYVEVKRLYDRLVRPAF
jgi:CRP-like cAMP-binding protein